MSPMPSEYPVLLHALDADDGGGYLAVVIDCSAARRTVKPRRRRLPAQAAIAEWLAIAVDMNWPIPDPSPPQGAEVREEAKRALGGYTDPLTTSRERDWQLFVLSRPAQCTSADPGRWSPTR